MNSYKVQLCERCCGVKCTEHDEGSFQEWMCEICDTSYPTQLAGNRCCYDMIDKTTVGASGLAKVPKPKRNPELEFPTRALTGERDK